MQRSSWTHHGSEVSRHKRGPKPVVRTILQGCEVESRNTYKGVPLALLPAAWEAEDRVAEEEV